MTLTYGSWSHLIAVLHPGSNHKKGRLIKAIAGHGVNNAFASEYRK